jgi:hypothetical protein
MNSQIGSIVKILIISIALSFAVKYGGRIFAIAPTHINALLGILILPATMAIALIWRGINPTKIPKQSP